MFQSLFLILNMSFHQFKLHELGSPLEKEFEFCLGLGFAGNNIVGCFILKLAVAIPFEYFEEPSLLQELHVLPYIMCLIC